ncbi:MAG TPA: DeoR family transcriptional regulator [Longimicrobiales bacterium]|nr:DeoR family transcriptional regulator [Longimicrobiales bacterium]
MSDPPSSLPAPVAAEAAVAIAPGSRQQEILVLLKQSGGGTIPDLAERTGLNVETVRHHLQALSKQGLVERTGTRAQGRGRPEIVYGLAAAADSLFPRREGEVLSALADHLKATGNEAALESFFEAYIDARRPAALARVRDLRGRARVEEVARILSELGFMALVEPGREPALRLCNCPIRELVGATTIPCRAELGFVRELLGGERLTRLSYIPAGDASCTYAADADAVECR